MCNVGLESTDATEYSFKCASHRTGKSKCRGKNKCASLDLSTMRKNELEEVGLAQANPYLKQRSEVGARILEMGHLML